MYFSEYVNICFLKLSLKSGLQSYYFNVLFCHTLFCHIPELFAFFTEKKILAKINSSPCKPQRHLIPSLHEFLTIAAVCGRRFFQGLKEDISRILREQNRGLLHGSALNFLNRQFSYGNFIVCRPQGALVLSVENSGRIFKVN